MDSEDSVVVVGDLNVNETIFIEDSEHNTHHMFDEAVGGNIDSGSETIESQEFDEYGLLYNSQKHLDLYTITINDTI